MKIKGDTATTAIGLFAGLLVVQQTYLPDLFPKEYTAPLVATLLGGYGISTNKEEFTIPLTEQTKKQKRLCELEAEIRQLQEELEMSRGFYPEERELEDADNKTKN